MGPVEEEEEEEEEEHRACLCIKWLPVSKFPLRNSSNSLWIACEVFLFSFLPLLFQLLLLPSAVSASACMATAGEFSKKKRKENGVPVCMSVVED
jgi:hypothetical protein